MGTRRAWLLTIAVVAGMQGASAALAQAPMSRPQALAALEHADFARRAVALQRLAEIGTMADTERVARLLRDDEPQVRELANLAMWQIWGRSGDKAIDALFERGVVQMEAGELTAALATFNEIVQRRPAFAEGWNKRATILFLLENFDASLKDCHEVLQRNKLHYGALSGMGQIHLQRGELDLALQHFRRALTINPNLPGVIEAVRSIERHRDGATGTRT